MDSANAYGMEAGTGNVQLKEVDSCKYLGDTLFKDSTYTLGVHIRITKATVAMVRLAIIIFRYDIKHSKVPILLYERPVAYFPISEV